MAPQGSIHIIHSPCWGEHNRSSTSQFIGVVAPITPIIRFNSPPLPECKKLTLSLIHWRAVVFRQRSKCIAFGVTIGILVNLENFIIKLHTHTHTRTHTRTRARTRTILSYMVKFIFSYLQQKYCNFWTITSTSNLFTIISSAENSDVIWYITRSTFHFKKLTEIQDGQFQGGAHVRYIP